MVDSEEKRNFHRMNIDSDASVTLASSNESFTVRVKDLSATGLQFRTHHELSPGDELLVYIEPGKAGITLPFHARVAIIHVEEIVAEREYSMGCKLIEMLPVE